MRMIVPVESHQVHRNRIDIVKAVEIRVQRAGRQVEVAVRTIPRGLHRTGLTRRAIQGLTAGPWVKVGR